MKKISDFLVEKRYMVLTIMIIIAIACGILTMKVNINSDMSKYLPDASGMKTGLNIMEEQFPTAEDSGNIRVMFDNLDNSQKKEVLEKLKAIKYVDSVDYEADSKEYNNGNHTLYVMNFNYDYGTDEAAAVEKDLSSFFDGYDMVYHVDNDETSLPTYIVVLAFAILMIILFLMSASWLEPFLFLATIGFAIVINMGTNIFLGTVSQITYSIASILQLVLSMDYSIMLINRYRQELEKNSDTKTAMKNAIVYAFSSITSSSVTTIVGLLALCFMKFKIGMDLGIVLAKGVFISLICIYTILPAFILICHKGIRKTSKKVLEVKMDGLGRFSYKFRHAIAGIFVIIFAGAFILSNNTKMAYVLLGQDPTEEFFPKASKIVLLYENKDETAAEKLISQYEKNSEVKEVQSFANTLGKEYSSKELAEKMAEMSEAVDLDPSLLDIIYYDYYAGDKTGSITVSNFINFIVNDVMTNKAYADKFDADIKDNMNTMKKLASADNLTKQMNIEEIAGFFGMEEENISQLFMYYFMKNGGVDTGTMTLTQFASFIAKDVVKNKEYASMFDAKTLSMIDKVKTFTNKTTVTTPLSSTIIASTLGMDESMVKMLLVFYYSNQESFNAGVMTLPQFVSFLRKDVASNKMFASYFDSSKLTQINMLAQFTNKGSIQTKLNSEQLSAALGMDENMIKGLLTASGVTTMSIQEFVDYVLKYVVTNEQYACYFDKATIGQLTFMQNIMNVAISGDSYDYNKMAGFLSMDPAMVKMLYTYNTASYGDTNSWKISLQTMVNFIVKDLSQNIAFSSMFKNDTLKQLTMLQKLINGTVAGTQYTSAKLSNLLGMDADKLNQLYLLYNSKHGYTSGWKISAQKFVNFINSDVLTNKDFSDRFDKDTKKELHTAKTIIDAVVSGKTYTAKELAKMFSGMSEELNENTMNLMYLFYFSTTESNPAWKLSIEDMFNFLSNNIMKDPRFEEFIDADSGADIDDMKGKMKEGKAQLMGPNYSRMILTTTLQDGSNEANAFMEELTKKSDAAINGKYYLIGNTPMAYEMSQTFGSELNFITILTAIAIFIVIALTFKSLLIPLILVLIIQGGVYLTISIIGIQGYSIYYLALLIVECILMGATVDYAILFTNYFKENRKTMDCRDALIAAYNGSIHTILTSGLIMVLVTGIVGYAFANPTVGQICQTISKGALCAILLIVFILPGVLSIFDKFINGKNNGSTNEEKKIAV